MNYSNIETKFEFESIKHIIELELKFPYVRLMGESELENQMYVFYVLN